MPASIGNAPSRSPSQPIRRPRTSPASNAAGSGGSASDSGARGIGPTHHREQQREVRDSARHRAVGDELRRQIAFRFRQRRHAPGRGAQTEHAVPAGGIAQRAGEVAAVGKRHHAQRQGDRGAPRAASRTERGIEGVARRAENLVGRVRAESKLRRVGLADEDRAGSPQPLDEERIVRGHMIVMEPRAPGRTQPARLREILHGMRESMQRPARDPACELVVAVLGLREQRLGRPQRDDGVDGRVRHLDSRQMRRHHLAARHFFRADHG